MAWIVEMPRLDLPEIETLRARARRCRQLADGVEDLEFAMKLDALSEEYEDPAKQTKVQGRKGWRRYTSHPKRVTITRS